MAGRSRHMRVGFCCVAVLTASLSAAACAPKSRVKAPPGIAPEKASCLESESTREYMDRVYEAIYDAWELAPGFAPDQTVKIEFRLDPDGQIGDLLVREAPDTDFGQSAINAFWAASPFGPMPDSAKCLSRIPILATMSNPR